MAPRDGSGVYSKPPGTTAIPNTTVASAPYNALQDDMADALTESLPRTGVAPMLADLPMNGKKITGLDDGADPGDAVNFGQLEEALDDKLNTDASNVGDAAAQTVFRDAVGAASLLDVRRNRIVNHDMRMSQENGTSSGTDNGYYAADQWATYRVTSAGTITSAQVASVTPAGSPNRYRVTITTPDASLAAGEYLTISQNLEGSNVVDFQYGGPAAVDSVLRFGFKGPAGTYAVHLGNSAADRSFVALFTIEAGEANTDTVQTIAIPGDTSGTWLTADGVIGITLEIVLACGTTFQGAAGWQSGNILGTSAVSNGMGTGSAVFELFDVGLRLDPDAAGVYGQYEVGGVDAVYRSERYWEKSYLPGVALGTATKDGIWSFNGGVHNATYQRRGVIPFLARKAKKGTFSYWDAVGNAERITVVNQSGIDGDNQPSVITSNCGTSAVDYYFQQTNSGYLFHWTVNARLS